MHFVIKYLGRAQDGSARAISYAQEKILARTEITHHAGFRLQASERNIKGLEFCSHGTITLADVMTLLS